MVIADSTPTYFVSGIYYFEKRCGSQAMQVVAGTGKCPVRGNDAPSPSPGTDQRPVRRDETAVSTTFVFGANGRSSVDTVTRLPPCRS
ncbi:MAG: hypothetical protein H6514_09620 [Acidimicrobiaceae bacterium]|nr:hypothetical protein [Acidimicrobiaceae bacterium]